MNPQPFQNLGRAARRLIALRLKAAERGPDKTWRDVRNPCGARSPGVWQAAEDAAPRQSPAARPYYCDTLPAWRDLGSAHDVARREGARMDHNGWYCDAHQSALVVGRVLQRPARNGEPQYIPAITWTESDGVTVWPLDAYSEPLEAARAADHYAELIAEGEREHAEAWQAGSDFGEKADLLRRTLLDLETFRALAKAKRKHKAAERETFARTAEKLDDAADEIQSEMDALWKSAPHSLESAFLEGAQLTQAEVITALAQDWSE